MLVKNRRAFAPEPTAEDIKKRAEARFKMKEKQKIDSPLAMKEYRAAQQSVLDRTAKLREERRTREAAGWVKPE